jgi:hypothetical protein
MQQSLALAYNVSVDCPKEHFSPSKYQPVGVAVVVVVVLAVASVVVVVVAATP